MEMTIDQVVRRALLETGYTIHMYPYFYNYAMHGLQEMEIDTIGNIKELELPSTTSYSNVNIGVIIDVKHLNGGHYQPIPKSEDLSFASFNAATSQTTGSDFLFTFSDTQINVKRLDVTKGVKASLTIGNEYEYNGFNFNVHGEPKGRLFGNASGNSCVWQYDPSASQLAVANASNKDLHIVYLDISNEKAPSSVVNPLAVEALTQYIRFRHMDGKRSVQVNDKMQARRDWQNAYRLLRARKYQLSVEDILQSYKKSYGLAPK